MNKNSERKREREGGREKGARTTKQRLQQLPLPSFLLRIAGNNANFGITSYRAGINMKGEVSISNWYLGDPKQSQVRAKVDELLRTYPCNLPSLSLSLLPTLLCIIRVDDSTHGCACRFKCAPLALLSTFPLWQECSF